MLSSVLLCSRICVYFVYDIKAPLAPVLMSYCARLMMRPGSLYGSDCNNTVLITLKIAVFAPMPRASVKIATTVNPGFFLSTRKANFTSCHKVCISRAPEPHHLDLLDRKPRAW